MSHNEELEIVRRILKAGRTAIVTTRAKSGALHSRPLALLDDDFEGTLWFFTEDPSEKTDEIRRHSEVNVSVSDDKGYLSLSGAASIDRTQARIDMYWNAFAEGYFHGGPEDPKVALLRIDIESVEYWDTDQPLVKRAFEVAKTLITKKEPDLGDSGTVKL
ncbi:MAG: pyridoxamine 5'-phosphate oxidase family protein [Microbacteriaceae bacterium]